MTDFDQWFTKKGIPLDQYKIVKEAWDHATMLEKQMCVEDCEDISISFAVDDELSAVARICKVKILMRGLKI